MLNQRWSRLASGILGLYEELDRELASFTAASGLHCPPGCGACCLSPEVESTVAEMLPLALVLFERGEVEATLKRLQGTSRLCAQYEAHPIDPEKGRCRNYAQRPVLCRLFGHGGLRDKSGRPRYGACRVFQRSQAETVQRIDQELKSGQLSIPSFARARERVAEIAGDMACELLPINEALLRAIERVGLSLQLEPQDARERRLSV